MTAKIRNRLRNCKRRIQRRLRKKKWREQRRRMFKDHNIHYDRGTKNQGTHGARIGAIQRLVQKIDVADLLDSRLHRLQRHLPYFESDHGRNLTDNILAGGTCLEAIELLRNHETDLNLLAGQRIPDPTTEGDCRRRFQAEDVETLLDVINDRRRRIWQQQPPDCFRHALIAVDGTWAETTGECKAGLDLSDTGIWGYHPLLVSVANTPAPLFLDKRPGRRPRHEHAAAYWDRALPLGRPAGFGPISFRGDTDFSQTAYLDRWQAVGGRLVLGSDALPNLVAGAPAVPSNAGQELTRPAASHVTTPPRRRPVNGKEHVVQPKGYRNLVRVSEPVAECRYRPGPCQRDYRLVVVRKNLCIEERGGTPSAAVRYFFDITNEEKWTCAEIVAFAQDRCNQENLIAQWQSGVRALGLPANTWVSNWADRVIGAWAWTWTAWRALVQSRGEPRQALRPREFKKFLQELMRLPCQIVRAGRRLIDRLLQWNPWVTVLCQRVEVLGRTRLP